MDQKVLTVWQVPGPGGSKVWWMSDGTKSGGPGSYPAVNVAAKTNADFTYTIKNTPGVTFSNDPIWIQGGTAKPTQHVVDGHFNVPPGQNGAKLGFHDNNKGNPQTLTYILRFSDGTSTDPIVNNGGGGPGFHDNIVWYVGAAVILAIIVAVIVKFRKSGPVERTSQDH